MVPASPGQGHTLAGAERQPPPTRRQKKRNTHRQPVDGGGEGLPIAQDSCHRGEKDAADWTLI